MACERVRFVFVQGNAKRNRNASIIRLNRIGDQR